MRSRLEAHVVGLGRLQGGWIVRAEHARAKAERERFALADIEDAVLGHHERRERNPREADWVLRVGRLVVINDWPTGGDALRARHQRVASAAVASLVMSFNGHYDRPSDIAWIVLGAFDGEHAIGHQEAGGYARQTSEPGELVALEFWHASVQLPSALLD